MKSDATSYAEEQLNPPNKKTFGYSNLAWQLLAFRFEEITGVLPSTILENIIGTEGWSWETDAVGHCLGPHGLNMTVQAAKRLGSVAKSYFEPSDFVLTTPSWFWNFNNHPVLGRRYVYHGWFCHKAPIFILYSVGFMLQYIVVLPDDIRVQLRGSKQADFDKAPSEKHAAFFGSVVEQAIS